MKAEILDYVLLMKNDTKVFQFREMKGYVHYINKPPNQELMYEEANVQRSKQIETLK